MNDIAIYRGIIDACCFIVGYLSKLEYDRPSENLAIDVLVKIARSANSLELEEVDKLFLPKKSEL